VALALFAAACSGAPEPAALPAEVTRQIVALPAAGADGRTPLVALQVPEGTSAVTLVLRGPAGALLTLDELRAPDGTVWVPPGWSPLAKPVRTCGSCKNRVTTAPTEAGFLLPVAPTLGMPAGTWRLRALAYDRQADGGGVARSGPLQLEAWLVRARPSNSQTPARLDLNVCLTGARGITAEIAPQHPRIQTALTDLAQVLERAGLALGVVRFVDVAAPQLVIAHDGGADAEVSALFGAAKGLPPGLNVFLVDQLYLAGSLPSIAPIRGLSGGIPGPVRTAQGARAGVVLSLELGPGESDLLGVSMAHEIGHYLGLFHTSEAKPAANGAVISDPIADTPPESPTNLMHWSAPSVDEAVLSVQQVAVLYGSPWLRP
jgi:hypothetical protein